MSTPTENLSLLRAVNLFAEAPDDLLAELAQRLEPLEYPAGETILHKGEAGDSLYIIVDGRVRVFDSGRLLNYLGPGEVFGEMSMLDAQTRSASVATEEPTRLLRLCQAEFLELAADNVEIAHGVIRVLVRHLRARMQDLQADYAYIQQMQRLTAAAVALETGRYDPRTLEEVAQRGDDLGQLARVFRRMAGEVLARERRLRLEAIERDLQTGRRIQASFLPSALPQPPGWEITALFEPAREVSGDFYDVFLLAPGGPVGLAVADVCDKGVGAALFMALFRTVLRVFAQQPAMAESAVGDLAEHVSLTVRLVNDYIAETHGQTSMFATLFFGLLEPATGRLHYINGGHEPPAILGPQGVRAELQPTGPIVGALFGMPFAVRTVTLEPGEWLVAYTDGVTEARNPSREMFEAGRLLALLQPQPDSAIELVERVRAAVHDHMAAAEQFDDITLLAVRRQAA